MRNTRIVRVAALLGIVALAAVWIGCGGKSDESDESAAPPTTIHPGGKPVDAATAGSISGMIMLDGAPPAPKTINMAGVPPCAKQHAAGERATTEDVVPGDGGTLQNVVVYLKGDFGAYSFDVPQTPASLDQGACQFRPHVVALMVGQPLDVASSDPTGHNVNAMAKINAAWNHTLAPRAQRPYRQSFTRPEVAIPVKCNIHPWMKAYIAVLDSPYFAVTGKDGTFALRNVPPGTYTLTAWHEAYGSTEQSITVAPHEDKTVMLSFKSAASD